MHRYSLMTTSMTFEFMARVQQGESKKEVYRDYCSMLEKIREIGYEFADITSMEIELFGLEAVKRAMQRVNGKVVLKVQTPEKVETKIDRSLLR